MINQNYSYPQTRYAPQPLPQYLKGRPVSSLEEVRATGIDFDGTVFYFPDLANKRIYTKQISTDGTAVLSLYEKTELPLDTPTSAQFITRDEFNQVMKQLQEKLAPVQAPEVPAPQTFNF